MPDFFCAECNTVIQLPDGNPPESCSVCGNISSMRRLFAHGETLGGCTVIKHLSAKGAISFYLAEQTAVKRQVVLKVLDTSIPAGANILGKFQESARKSVKYLHSGIVSVLNAGKENQFYYTITPCIQGKTLAALIQEGRRFTPEEALKTLQAPAEALQYIWNKQQFCHGRLTAENIIISTDGDTFLLNFWDQVEEYRNVTENDALFSAPECMQTKAEKVSADLYTFGVLLFYMVSGTLPWQTLTPEARNEAISANRSFLQFIPFIPGMTTLSPAMAAEFKSFLEKLVSPDPALRINDWGEYLDKVESLQNFFKAPPVLTLKKNEVKNALPVVPAIPLQEENRTEKSKKKEAGTAKKEIQKKAKETKQKKKKSFAEKFFIVLLQILILAGGVYAGYFLLVRYPHLDKIHSVQEQIKLAEKEWEKNPENFAAIRTSIKIYAKKTKVEKFFKEELKKLDEKYSLIEKDLEMAKTLRKKYQELLREFNRSAYGFRIYYSSQEQKFISRQQILPASFRQEQNNLLEQLRNMKDCLAKSKQGSSFLEKMLDKERTMLAEKEKAFLTFCAEQEKLWQDTVKTAKGKEVPPSTAMTPAVQKLASAPPPAKKQVQTALSNTGSAPAPVLRTNSAKAVKQQQKDLMLNHWRLRKYNSYSAFFQKLDSCRVYYHTLSGGYVPQVNYSYEKFRTLLPELQELLSATERQINAGNIQLEKDIFNCVKSAFANLCTYANDPAIEKYTSLFREYAKQESRCGVYYVAPSCYFTRNYYKQETFNAGRAELKNAIEKLNNFFASPVKTNDVLVKFFETRKRNNDSRNLAYNRFIHKDMHSPVLQKLQNFRQQYSNLISICNIYSVRSYSAGRMVLKYVKGRNFNAESFRQNKDRLLQIQEDLVKLCNEKHDVSNELQNQLKQYAVYYSSQQSALKNFCSEFEKQKSGEAARTTQSELSTGNNINSQSAATTSSRSVTTSYHAFNWQALSPEERLEKYKEICLRRLNAACFMFLNSPPLTVQIYNRSGHQIFIPSVFRMPVTIPAGLENDPEIRKVQQDTRNVISRFASLYEETRRFGTLIGQSAKRYSGASLYLDGRRCYLVSIAENGRHVTTSSIKMIPLNALGKRNLIEIVKYAAKRDGNVKKHALAFLLKLYAFDDAEEFATTMSERRIINLLRNRYPGEMRSNSIGHLLRMDIRHQPARISNKSQQELDALQKAIEKNRQKYRIQGGRVNNYNRR